MRFDPDKGNEMSDNKVVFVAFAIEDERQRDFLSDDRTSIGGVTTYAWNDANISGFIDSL